MFVFIQFSFILKLDFSFKLLASDKHVPSK